MSLISKTIGLLSKDFGPRKYEFSYAKKERFLQGWKFQKFDSLELSQMDIVQ